MSDVPSMPSLSVTYIKALSAAVQNRGWLAYIPFSFLSAAGAALCSFFLVPKSFWGATAIGNSIMIYAGILTFSGILLAVGWSSFAKVYEILGRGNLSRMLKNQNLLDVHFMYVSIANFMLTVFVVICAIGLLSLTVTKPVLLDQIILASICGSGILAITATFNISKFLQQLIWDEIYYQG